jgi:hypothetical protein
MKQETWARLDREFSRFPMMKASAASQQEIEEAAEALGCFLQKDYIDFLLRYGGAIVGPYPIFGLHRPPAMGAPWSFVDVTKQFRADGWKGTCEWCIISEDGFGNPIGVSSDGKVWVSDHDAGQITEIAANFEEFLRQHCLGMVVQRSEKDQT